MSTISIVSDHIAAHHRGEGFADGLHAEFAEEMNVLPIIHPRAVVGFNFKYTFFHCSIFETIIIAF
jgi:hypothetical protein